MGRLNLALAVLLKNSLLHLIYFLCIDIELLAHHFYTLSDIVD